MKQFFSIFLVLIFLTGCAINNLSNGSKYSKETLINKANIGDLNAMIELAKYYDFPQTIEGLKYFDKWYANIDINNDPKLIALVGEIYYDYNDMFLDGQAKALKLLNEASKKGSLDAKVSLIKHYTIYYKNFQASKIENEIIEKLSVEQLQKLYTFYINKYKREKAEKIATYIAERGGEIPFDLQLKNINSTMYLSNSKSKIEKIVKKTIESKDSKKIFELADLFKKKYQFKQAVDLYNEVLKIDDKNAEAYYNLSFIYTKGNYRQKIEKDKKKANEYLKKAVSLQHLDASVKLLEEYSRNKDTLDEYLELKDKLIKHEEGLKALAQYYKNKNYKEKALELYNQLAEEGNEDAIIELATKTPYSYNFHPEEYLSSKKWQAYILSSNNQKLKDNFVEKVINNSTYKRYFPELIEKIHQDILISDNILKLRKYALKNRYSNLELSMKLYEKASNAGDIKSSLALVSIYTSKKANKYNEAIKVLESLIEKGDKKAAYKLAHLYLFPPYFMKKEPEDKKALAIYEKLAKEDKDIEAMEELITYHLCYSCKKDKKRDAKTGFYYMKMLYEQRKSASDYASMGWAYAYGKGVEKDLKKAEDFYIQAAKEGYTSAYYNLAWLYYRDSFDKEIIKLDYKKAREYLELGAKNYDYPSINLLGVFYRDGLGVRKNMQKAIKLFEKASRYDKYAAKHLAKYYKQKKDYKNAIKYYEYAKNKRDAAAQLELGVLYEKGQGTKKDMKKALEYYKQAYDNYSDDSQKDIAAYNIGLVYHYGKGDIEKDLKKAKAWYIKSNYEKAKVEYYKIEKPKKK